MCLEIPLDFVITSSGNAFCQMAFRMEREDVFVYNASAWIRFLGGRRADVLPSAYSRIIGVEIMRSVSVILVRALSGAHFYSLVLASRPKLPLLLSPFARFLFCFLL